MRLISEYNFLWSNLGSESPRENMFIMRQNGFLLNTKIVQDTLLNPKGQPHGLCWSVICPFNSPFSKVLHRGMKGWVRRYSEGRRGGMGRRSHQRGMSLPLTKAFIQPFLKAVLFVQDLRKTSPHWNGTLSSVLTRWRNAKRGSNSIIDFTPLRKGESRTLFSIWQPLASLTTWTWAAPSHLARKLRLGTR